MSTNALWMPEKARSVRQILKVKLTFVLTTPCHLGSGNLSDVTDMPLLISGDGRGIIPGTSLAGAIRAYITRSGMDPVPLLGAEKANFKNPIQSRLSVNDAFADAKTIKRSVWRGNVLNPESRTAKKGGLYDTECYDAGTKFSTTWKLDVSRTDGIEVDLLKKGLAGIQSGEIRLGKDKSGSFGRMEILRIEVQHVDLADPDAYLRYLAGQVAFQDVTQTWRDAFPASTTDSLQIQGCFSIVDSLLTGDGVLDGDASPPDAIQKRARSSQANGGVPVISGLTLKRRIRAHAVKIATLCRGDVEGQALVDRMFGGTSRASRVSVGFGWIEGGQTNLALPRIKIDRLTGGVIDSALFWSLPVSSDLLDSQHRANLSIAIELRKRSGEDAIDPAEIGLLMHCLKDVWTQ